MTLVLEDLVAKSIVRLEGDVNISHAAELKELWLKAIDSGKELAVCLDSTTDLDITALQLLYAAQHHAICAGVAFSVEGAIPVEIGAVMADAGFEILLGAKAER